MKILPRYLLQLFFPVLIVSLLFFMLLLELGDLFAHLAQYLQNGVSFITLMQVMYLYVPKCISFAMPIAVLFSSAYTMGTMYTRNELTSVFAAGMPLRSLVTPLILLGFLFSVGMFFFEDKILIHYQHKKQQLVDSLLEPEKNLNSSDVVILSDSGKNIYFADYYDDAEKKLSNVLIVMRTEYGSIQGVVKGSVALWNGSFWNIEDRRVYWYTENSEVSYTTVIDESRFIEPPVHFRRNISSVDEMTITEAWAFIQKLRRLGLPYHEHLSKYYRRFSFPFTIFIVLFLSVSIGGRFRKNILLMSLLFSLSIATLYYVTEMMTMLFAKWEYISPLAGAALPFLLFTVLSVLLLRLART